MKRNLFAREAGAPIAEGGKGRERARASPAWWERSGPGCEATKASPRSALDASRRAGEVGGKRGGTHRAFQVNESSLSEARETPAMMGTREA